MPSINTTVPSRFVLVETTAQMPNSVKAAYKHCAVVEIDADFTGTVPGISERYRGVRRIMARWPAYPANGKTERSGRVQALAEANAMVAELNAAAVAV